MKFTVRIIFSVIIWLFAFTTHAQVLGSWNILNFQYHVNERYSFFGEAQLRSLGYYNQFHYHEFKGGINYNLYESLRFSIGAGDYDTYREGGTFVLPKNNDEFRLWPQVMLIQSIGKVKIEQRYRAEMRFTSNGYRNRFRYRLGLSYPFAKTEAGYYKWQLSLNNELFFTDNEPYFERNRAMIAIQYRIQKAVALQIGYIHQLDYKINDETGTDFMMLGLYFDLHKSFFNSGDFNSKDN